MSEFDPVTLFFILFESMGVWLWQLLGLALVLLVGIVASAAKLHRAQRPMRLPIIGALLVGLIVAVAATFAVPLWTHAGPGALGAAVDYAFAFLFALVPGAIAGSLIFMLAAARCARRGPATI
jgi:FtsH-binding integral membrane protein